MISKNSSIYKLFNEDCNELMKWLPTQSVDLILTDPPYNISQYSTGNIPREGKITLNNDIADWDKKIINPVEYVDVFKRIIKPRGNIIIFAGYNQIGDWHKAFDSEFDTFQMFVWHKTNPAPKVYRNGFCNSCEFVIFLWNKGHVWNFSTQEEMHNFFECPICSYPERLKDPFHPAQKPLNLIDHELKAGGNLDTKNAPSNAAEVTSLETMFSFCDKSISRFATCYDGKGDGTPDGAIGKHLDRNQILIGKEFWEEILEDGVSYNDFILAYQEAYKKAKVEETVIG